MIECEFDGALLACTGMAEALHAAGNEACVPLPNGGYQDGEHAVEPTTAGGTSGRPQEPNR